MLKYVVSAVLCLGAGVSCMSHEIPREVDLLGDKIESGILYIGCANMHLLLHDYEIALLDFRRASFCAEQSDEEMAKAIELMVLFGQTICYDNLNLRDKCEQSLSSLILLMGDGSFDLSALHTEEYEITEESEVIDEEYKTEEYEVVVGEHDDDDDMHGMAFVKQLIELAPSDDIREILSSIIEKGTKE